MIGPWSDGGAGEPVTGDEDVGRADFPLYQAAKIGAPMVDGAVVNVECRVVGSHALGHTLFIGEAVWARYDDEKHPLLFHDGRYWRLGSQVPKA